MGAWIEIYEIQDEMSEGMSLPLWERGLKYKQSKYASLGDYVAPLVGAWIEMSM